MARRKEPQDWSGNGGEGRKMFGPEERREKSSNSSRQKHPISEKREDTRHKWEEGIT